MTKDEIIALAEKHGSKEHLGLSFSFDQLEAFAAALAQQATGEVQISLYGRIADLIAQHGSLRAVARVLECDPGYLSRLASSEKSEPSDLLLRRMGLRRVVTYKRLAPGVSQEVVRAVEGGSNE